MKIQYLSDLHLESHAFTLKPHPDADVVVLAGDIAAWSARNRMHALIRSCPKPIVYIPGNHEAYGASMDDVWKNGRATKNELSHFHDLTQYPHCYHHGKVLFIGAPLWTDFKLPFKDGGKYESNQKRAMEIAQAGINDFRVIRDFTTEDALKEHALAMGYLRAMIERHKDSAIVVVTHFLPSAKSIDPQFAGSNLNPYFASDCEQFMGGPVKLWIHGHTHHSCDYMLNGTRVVCNPRGYTAKENPAFTSQQLVEVVA